MPEVIDDEESEIFFKEIAIPSDIKGVTQTIITGDEFKPFLTFVFSPTIEIQPGIYTIPLKIVERTPEAKFRFEIVAVEFFSTSSKTFEVGWKTEAKQTLDIKDITVTASGLLTLQFSEAPKFTIDESRRALSSEKVRELSSN